MINISLCMIVKDEEDTLGRCLDSTKDLVDEIIIVDTGSTDKTKELAFKYTDKIYDFKWVNDFSAARNFSFSKATKDYIFWLDADDILLEDDREKFKILKKTLKTNVDSVSMLYDYAFNKNGDVILSFRRNRLVKRENNFKWIGAIHEYIDTRGYIIDSDIHITHNRTHCSLGRNLKIFENMLKEGKKFTTRDTYYYANELYDNKIYDKAITYYDEFLNTPDGWYEDKINTCGKVADYYSYINNLQKAKEYCFKSFEYDIPRAEFCCRLGYYFLTENSLNLAIFWYELATTLKKPSNSWGFFNDSCWTWLPHIQLCVCYDRLGDYKLAYEHNTIAEKYSPNNEYVLYNKKYFETLKIT